MWFEDLGMTKVLFDTQIVKCMTRNITNPNMVKKAFINNNIFSQVI